MARVALTTGRGWAADSWNARLRLNAENDRLRQEVGLLLEELRIKDARMARIPAQRRPHYPPTERLAILELRAARGWSLAQTASRLLITPLAAWTGRLDDGGAEALIQIPEPVNRFPEFVGYVVRRLKCLCPTMGRVRIARMLTRAGLHLGSTTVRRMLRAPRPQKPAPAAKPVASRRITARRPNDLWHVDLTTVPTGLGFWISWMPQALPQSWPFCWWLGVAVDHHSRRVMGFALFRRQPTAKAVGGFLNTTIGAAGRQPKHLVTDHGRQFVARGFRSWCRRRGIRQPFGAIGKYGSLAVIERAIRTFKTECTRRLTLVPYRLTAMQRELALFVSWYNGHRPHSRFAAATPDEIYHHRRPPSRSPRFEPRPLWPRRSPCASPQALIRGRPGATIRLGVRHLGGRRHLPVVSLKRVA
jgi:transposase InsO family protein